MIRKTPDTVNMPPEEKLTLLQQRVTELEENELELRSARNALIVEQRFLTELTDRLPGMAYKRRNNRGWTMDYVSRGCLLLTGFQAEELTGNNKVLFSRLINSEDGEKAALEIQAALKARKDYHVHFRITDRSGTEKWILEQGHGVYGDDGEPATLIGFISDITEDVLVAEKLRESTASLKKTMVGTIQAVSKAMAFRDPYTAGHEKRVCDLAAAMATRMALSEIQVEGIRMAGLIHDIGKIYIPVEILSRPGRLNDIEMSLIKAHSQAGYEILKDVEFTWPIAEIVFQHHERIDGTGYPRKLKDLNILIEAKIIAVADVVEAMASHRPYRPALGIDAALAEIRMNKGRSYDEAAVDACLDLFEQDSFYFDNVH